MTTTTFHSSITITKKPRNQTAAAAGHPQESLLRWLAFGGDSWTPNTDDENAEDVEYLLESDTNTSETRSIIRLIVQDAVVYLLEEGESMEWGGR